MTEPEGAEALARDLARLDEGQYQLVAEWMIEHGWTEPLDPVPADPQGWHGPDRCPRCGVRNPHSWADCVLFLRIGLQRQFEAEVALREVNTAYMLADCDGTTPLGETHTARKFRRTDCRFCNGENNRTRVLSWEDWLRATLAGVEPVRGWSS